MAGPGGAGPTLKDPLVADARDAILDFELNRLHQTYVMIDFETFREDFRYIYRNGGIVPHSVAPLLWRNRGVQANMYVLDRAGANLIYLPHEMSISAAQECIESLLQRGLGHPSVVALGFQQALSPPTSAEIATALAFESPMATRETVFAKARELSAKFPAVSEFSKVATLLQFSLGFYLPLALFDVPVMPGQMSFVRHGVDIYRRLVAPAPEGSFLPVGARLARFTTKIVYSLLVRTSKWWKLARLFFGRRYDFEVPLALDAPYAAGTRSFHLRVVVPPGLRVVKTVELMPSEVFGEKDLLRFASYDESNLYVYLRMDEIKAVLGQRDLVKRRRTAELEKLRSVPSAETLHVVKHKLMKPTLLKWFVDFLVEIREIFLRSLDHVSKVHLTVKVPLSFARGIPTLIIFLWVPAVILLITAALGRMDLNVFVAGLGVLFVVMLTIGIFAIDRRVLRGLVLAHSTMALALVVGSFILSILI